jgi:hypothetical protein
MTNVGWLPDFHQRPKVSDDSAGEVGMSRLELAANRLTGALESLESAIAPKATQADHGAKWEGRIADMEAERERLLTRIAELEEELAAMAGVTEDIEERLDGAIGEIRAVLAR